MGLDWVHDIATIYSSIRPKATLETSPWHHGGFESATSVEEESPDDAITPNAPQGMQKAEAVALVWSRKDAYTTYGLICFCSIMLVLESNIDSTTPTFDATDSQEQTMLIVQQVLREVLKIPAAQLLNLWGRMEGFMIFVCVYLLRIVVLASCNDYTTYAVGNTFRTLESEIITFILSIFIIDITEVGHRALALGLTGIPSIINLTTKRIIGNPFLQAVKGNWRLTYGTCDIITPVALFSLACVLRFYLQAARAKGVYTPARFRDTRSTARYVYENDLTGSVLLKAAYILILLSINLVGIIDHVTYDSPQFIALLAIGACLLCGFSYGKVMVLGIDCLTVQASGIVLLSVFSCSTSSSISVFIFIGFLFKCLALWSTISQYQRLAMSPTSPLLSRYCRRRCSVLSYT